MKKVVLAVAAAAAVAAVAVGAWFVVADDEEVTTRGICGSASYELALDEEDGALEATFELQSTGADESWEVVVDQDGTAIFQDARETDADAELEVDVPVAGSTDEVAVTATPAGGTPCSAVITR